MFSNYKLGMYDEMVSGLTDCEVEDVCVGVHGVWVKSSGLGISLRYENREHASVKNSGKLAEKSAITLSEYIKSWDFTEASIGLAALNSLLSPEGERRDAFSLLDEMYSEDKRIGIIGYFPWAERMKNRENVWVFERRPPQAVFPDTSCEYLLPKCDIVMMTGSALINKTLPRLLELSEDACSIVLGPSTPHSPVLFEHGVDVIAGSRIKNESKAMKKIKEGARVCEVNNCLEHLVKFNPESGEF